MIAGILEWLKIDITQKIWKKHSKANKHYPRRNNRSGKRIS